MVEPSKAEDKQTTLTSHPAETVTHHAHLEEQDRDYVLKEVENIIKFVTTTYISTQDPPLDLPIDHYERIKDRINAIFTKYQLNPAQLDPFLKSVVSPLMKTVEEYLLSRFKRAPQESELPPPIHFMLSIVYNLVKIKGYKQIITFFPTKPEILEPALLYLVKARNNDLDPWESKYTIFIWLSSIITLSFDFSTVNPESTAFEKLTDKCDIFDNLIEISKSYLKSSTKIREGAGILLSRLFIRPEVQASERFKLFVEWAADAITRFEEDPFNSFVIMGIFFSLVEIFKFGSSEYLIKNVPLIFRYVVEEEQAPAEESKGRTATRKRKSKVAESSALRQLKIKLAKQVCQLFLQKMSPGFSKKPEAHLGYEDFKKSSDSVKLKAKNTALEENKEQASEISKGQTKENLVSHEEFLKNINADKINSVIAFLVYSCKDKETIIRTTSAKSIGKIAERLPIEIIDQIVTSLLKLFSPSETDGSWHGACFALSQIARRGLLPYGRLPEIFPLVFKAMTFDESQATNSIGSLTRDAACYVAWVLVKVYQPKQLKEHAPELAQHLLVTALFDREVSCRRSALIAFQEFACTHTEGSLSQCSSILEEVDYNTIGNRSNTYLNVSIFAGQYELFFASLVGHLAKIKLRNWDPEIRRLAAGTLSLFCPLNPEYMAKRILPDLIGLCLNELVQVRHGAIYGVSEIVLGLAGKSHLHCYANTAKDSIFLKALSKNEKRISKLSKQMLEFYHKYDMLQDKNNLEVLDKALVKEITDIVAKVEKARLYRGKGGEIVRCGICRFIQCISYAGIKLGNTTIRRYADTIDDCLKSSLLDVQENAERALDVFSQQYSREHSSEFEIFVERLLESASTDFNVAVTRGYTRGLASLSPDLVSKYWEKIFKVLNENCQKKAKDLDDYSTRRLAIIAFQKIVVKFLESDVECKGTNLTLSQEKLDEIFKIAFNLMRDYTTDHRGDVGSAVREATMYAMVNIIKAVCSKVKKNPEYPLRITEKVIYMVICEMLQQLAEKIDRTRLIAGSLLQELIDNYHSALPNYPHKEQIEAVFCKKNIASLMQLEHSETVQSEANAQILSEEGLAGGEVEFNKEYVYYWNMSHCVFPVIVPFLEYPEYSYNLIKGLAVSVGGLNESIAKHSFLAVRKYITDICKSANKIELIKDLLNKIVAIIRDHPNDDRILIPLFKTVDLIFNCQELLQEEVITPIANELVDLTSKEVFKAKSFVRVENSVGIFIACLSLRDTKVLGKLLDAFTFLLFHQYPNVRKSFADKLYLYLMGQGSELLGEELNDQFSSLLSENDWQEMSYQELEAMKEPTLKVISDIKIHLSINQSI